MALMYWYIFNEEIWYRSGQKPLGLHTVYTVSHAIWFSKHQFWFGSVGVVNPILWKRSTCFGFKLCRFVQTGIKSCRGIFQGLFMPSLFAQHTCHLKWSSLECWKGGSRYRKLQRPEPILSCDIPLKICNSCFQGLRLSWQIGAKTHIWSAEEVHVSFWYGKYWKKWFIKTNRDQLISFLEQMLTQDTKREIKSTSLTNLIDCKTIWAN